MLFYPSYGYFANASKTWLITKQQHLEAAQSCFLGTGVNITTKGRPYLGAPIGIDEYINSFFKNKVQQWSTELKTLVYIATTQTHVAYAAYTHGLTSRWSFLVRTTPSITDELLSLEAVIHTEFLPMICIYAICEFYYVSLIIVLERCRASMGQAD